MSLVPFSNDSRRAGNLAITVDRQGRLYLNRPLQYELSCVNIPIDLYVSYDKVNKRIGIAKTDVVRLTDVKPFRFDKSRSYAYARAFLDANGIPYDKSYKYLFDGKENGWWTFKLDDYEAPDQPKSTK